MTIRWMAGLLLAAATVLASAGPLRAQERALARSGNPSGYFGSGHELVARAARSAAVLA